MAVRFDIHEIKKILSVLAQESSDFGFFYESQNAWRLMIGNEKVRVDQIEHQPAFGLVSYDAKNTFETLASTNPSSISWNDFEFVKADTIVTFENDKLNYSEGAEKVLEGKLIKSHNSNQKSTVLRTVKTFSEDSYKQKVTAAINEIKLGNVYEINLCEESVFEGEIDPVEIFIRLMEVTEAPFCALMKLGERFIISGSPEMFLKKRGSRVSSSPIKGTARRATDSEEDKALAVELESDPKERAENTMIVDLVRNDLSRIAQKGTVQVDEYCRVKTFKTVHQLESTISCSIRPDVRFSDILQATFPMGSMTGAPKIAAMKLIEELEDFKRGAYSGSIGFTEVNGDFVLNVIIRTILYDRANRVVSFASGGAITYDSFPEKELEELLLKAEAMKKVLGVE